MLEFLELELEELLLELLEQLELLELAVLLEVLESDADPGAGFRADGVPEDLLELFSEVSEVSEAFVLPAAVAPPSAA